MWRIEHAKPLRQTPLRFVTLALFKRQYVAGEERRSLAPPGER